MSRIPSQVPAALTAPTLATAAPTRASAPPTAARIAAPGAQSVFEAAAPRTAAQGAMPAAWRGGPDTEIGRTIATMVGRMRQNPISIGGETPESLFTRNVLENPDISNDQILAMSRVPLEKLADSPEDRQTVEQRIPNARELDSHHFTVALVAAVTGVDPQQLSQVSPGLGMTGSPSTPLLFAPERTGLKLSTALHDFTDYMRAAGVAGVNKAVWGRESSWLSAAISLGGVPR